jgi:hypothetical protein
VTEAKGIDGIGKDAYLPILQRLEATTFYSSSFWEANLEESRGRPYQVHISTTQDLGLLFLSCMTSKVAGCAANGLTDRLEKGSQGPQIQALPLVAVSRHVKTIAIRDKRKGRTSS